MKFDLNAYVPFLLNRAGTRIASAFSARLKDYGITINSWRLLASLYQHGTLHVGQLSEASSIEMWTVSRMVTRMEKEGLLTRQREAKDARSVRVTLTDKGRKLVEDLIPHAKEHEAIPLEGFTAEETRMLQQMLERLYQNMDRLQDTDVKKETA